VIDGGSAADNAGVIHQNVDGAKVLDGLLHQARADCGTTHIPGQGNTLGAGFGDQFLRSGRRVRGAVDGHVGSCFGQRDGNARAQPARRSGDQCCLALQIECFKDQGSFSFPVGARI